MARPPAPFIVPGGPEIDVRFAAVGAELSRHIVDIALLQDRVTQLASRTLKAGDRSVGNITPNITSTTYVMAGIGVIITPDQNARGIAHVDGQIGNTTNNGTTYVQLCNGTGAAPAYGAPVPVGANLLGEPVRFLSASANDYTPFAQDALMSGTFAMTVGMANWIDLAVRVGSGAAVLTEIYLTAFELLDPWTFAP